MQVEVGQIYRDTYFDGVNDGKRQHRTIRIIEVFAAADKVRAETLTDCLGNKLTPPRKTALTFKTLRSGYEKVSS